MDGLTERLKNPVVAGVAGLLVGWIIGWFIFGWFIWPVEWTDASMQEVRSDLQADYLRMAIEDFDRNNDTELALQRWNELGEAAAPTYQSVVGEPKGLNPATINSYINVVNAGVPGVGDEDDASGGVPAYLWGACIVTLVFGVALLATYLFRRGPIGDMSAAAQAAEVTRATEKTDFKAIGEEAPLSQYMTTYMFGDDLFDDSFSIDSAAGEFLGECGVGIAETMGVGEPKRVNTFEVWLFDKNDIQTVTKVLMSEEAFADPAIQERLAAKGEPILAEFEAPVVLETATLHLVARVVDLSYGDDPALPPESYFNRMTLEIAVWLKS